MDYVRIFLLSVDLKLVNSYIRALQGGKGGNGNCFIIKYKMPVACSDE